MMSPETLQPNCTRRLNSAEKKRARDRRAQQNLRDKRNKHVKDLEQKVSLCKSLHKPDYIDSLLRACQALKEENACLRERHSQLHALIQSWGPLPPEAGIPEPNSPLDGDDSHVETFTNDCPTRFASRLYQHDQPWNMNTESPPIESPPDLAQSLNGSDDSGCPTLHQSADMSTSYSVGEDPVSAGTSNMGLSEGLAPFECDTLSCSPFNFASLLDANSADDESSETPEIGIVDLNLPLGSSPGAEGQRDKREATADIPILDHPIPQQIHKLGSKPSSPTDGISRKRKSRTGEIQPSPPQPYSPIFGIHANAFPAWACVPLSIPHSEFTPRYSPWEANIYDIIEAPDVPSAKALLFGSNKNKLAGSINRCLEALNCREPEKLAIGWLIYTFLKWRVDPTAERFARLPSYLQPASEQLQLFHYSFVDIVLWQRLRVNLIRDHSKNNYPTVLELFASSLKVRWPRDENMLELNEFEELVMRQKFVDKFMHEDGWGLSSKFIKQYPHLMEGLPIEEIMLDGQCHDYAPCN